MIRADDRPDPMGQLEQLLLDARATAAKAVDRADALATLWGMALELQAELAPPRRRPRRPHHGRAGQG